MPHRSRSRQSGRWRGLRIALLLVLLAVVALGQWQARALVAAWDQPLWVVLHPLPGDDSRAAAEDAAALDDARAAPLERFFAREAGRYGLGLDPPVVVRVGATPDRPPPLPPRDGGWLAIAWWSLKLRYWGFALGDDGLPADVRLAVRYFDPGRNPRLPHSLGLAEARVGIVNVFADDAYRGSNRVVVAHELLHTLGASDKYDPASNHPRHPEGYAEPGRRPRHPQVRAELMGGRIPLGGGELRMPAALDEVVIGPESAHEIGWPVRDSG
ncbi:MAG: hypothetical protein R3298_08665 [Gammaproteobacteria bacterium]|nr:hypothetical protein [Gammaproteobacteria bacterium]